MIDYYLTQSKVSSGEIGYHAIVTHTEGVDQKNFICPSLSAGDYTIPLTPQYSGSKDIAHPWSYIFNTPFNGK
jgi:hypothetical protein